MARYGARVTEHESTYVYGGGLVPDPRDAGWGRSSAVGSGRTAARMIDRVCGCHWKAPRRLSVRFPLLYSPSARHRRSTRKAGNKRCPPAALAEKLRDLTGRRKTHRPGPVDQVAVRFLCDPSGPPGERNLFRVRMYVYRLFSREFSHAFREHFQTSLPRTTVDDAGFNNLLKNAPLSSHGKKYTWVSYLATSKLC